MASKLLQSYLNSISLREEKSNGEIFVSQNAARARIDECRGNISDAFETLADAIEAVDYAKIMDYSEIAIRELAYLHAVALKATESLASWNVVF